MNGNERFSAELSDRRVLHDVVSIVLRAAMITKLAMTPQAQRLVRRFSRRLHIVRSP